MKEKNPKIVYAEPLDYFPKEIRKEYKLGEYAEKIDDSKMDEAIEKGWADYQKEQKQ